MAERIGYDKKYKIQDRKQKKKYLEQYLKQNWAKRKRVRVGFIGVWILMMVLAGGCQKQSEKSVKKESVTLEVLVQTGGETEQVFRELCESFTEETGINISCLVPSEGYEEILKTRMAVNDMPDVWDTHGWAVRRYKEYIRTLEDQPYVDEVNPMIRSFLEDDEGKLCALPVGMTVNGIIYNKSVLKMAQIDPDRIETWEDLTDAAEKIKQIGIRPFAFGGSDKWSIGCCILGMAGAYFKQEILGNLEQTEEKMTWEEWEVICDKMQSWRERGLIVEDSLRNTSLENGSVLREGKAAFGFSTGLSTCGLETKEKEKLGMMPYPAKENGGQKSIQVGDQISFAVNKDTPYEEEALCFLLFLARPENLERIAKARKKPSGVGEMYLDEGLDGVEALLESEEILKLPVFDRQYLPSGMWENLYQAGQEVLYGEEDTASQVAKRLQEACKSKW